MTQIIPACTHGKRTIGECPDCKAVYAKRRKSDRPRYLYDAAKARARKRGVPFTIVPTDVKVPTHCPVLGIPLDGSDRDHTASLDEVVQGLGYVPRNVMVISGRANRIKSDATHAELKAIECYVRLRSRYALKGVPDSW